VYVVGLVGLVTYSTHGFEGVLTRDLGLYAYAGEQVADGVPPYLGVLNRAGPLAHAIPAIGALVARAAGLDVVVTMRVVFMLIATLCLCLVYLLGRDVFRSRLSGLVTAAAFLTFHGFIQYASDGPREKTPMTLFVVGTLWAVTHRRWFLAGVCTSLATLCLQTSFYAALPAAAAGALFLARGRRIRALVGIGLGGLVPLAVLVVWFALAGSLRQSVDAFYVINDRYTVANPILEESAANWLDAQTAYGVSLWVLLPGLALMPLLSLAALWGRARRLNPALPVLAACAVGEIAGLAWTFKDYDSWADLFPVLPFAALGIGALFALVIRRLAVREAVVLTAVLSVGAACAVALDYSLDARSDGLRTQERSVDAVLAQLPAGATITSIEAPQPLVLTGRRNPTRYQMFRGGLQDYMDENWPGGLEGFQRDLVARRPDLISVGETVSRRWRAAIAPEYVYVGKTLEFGWYARADLGADTITALRRAAGYDPDDRLAQRPDLTDSLAG
jgi:4-amino-4-deoxy-L-arabinose transferase-like glycosyltransferase